MLWYIRIKEKIEFIRKFVFCNKFFENNLNCHTNIRDFRSVRQNPNCILQQKNQKWR